MVLLGFWACITAVLLLLNPGFITYLIVQLTVVWMVRSFFYYKSFIAVMADFLLVAVSMLFAIGVYLQTMSIGMSIWCLFLTQALCHFIPCDFKRKRRVYTGDDAFDKAYRSAEAAFRMLSNQAK